MEMFEATVDHVASIAHPNGDAEAGFDLTDFGSPGEFQTFLRKFDLTPGVVEDDGRRRYVWHNSDVVVVTGNNPITGEYSDPEMREPEKGYASYIGIEGDAEVVEEVYEYIQNNVDFIKGRNPDEREFI